MDSIPTRRLFELPGSNSTSVPHVAAAPEGVLATSENTGAAPSAVSVKYRPFVGTGAGPGEADMPLKPGVVVRNTRLAFAGSTAMPLIPAPASALPVPTALPVPATRVANGPATTGLVSAVVMR